MVRINEAELQATQAKLKKINDRATKRGFTGRIDLAATRQIVELTDEFGFERTEIWWDVELTGQAPSYNGWTFQATLDWEDDTVIVRSAPGSDPINRDQLKPSFCDHCRTDRVRKETYIVRNVDTGEQLQVGSTCIKDFLGWTGNIVFHSTEELGQELGFGGFGGVLDRVGTEYALAVAWALIKLDGYKPSSHKGSTKGDVLDVLFPPKTPDLTRRVELARIQELAGEAAERAAECIEFILSEEFSGASDYVQNLKTICAADTVSAKNIGFLASAPHAWARWQQQTLIREAEAKQTSDWLGAEGAKVTATATIKAISYVPSDYGTRTLYTLRDHNGNVIKWFATREAFGDKVGEEVTFQATVKRLETYRDVKQTVVVRAKALKGVKA